MRKGSMRLIGASHTKRVRSVRGRAPCALDRSAIYWPEGVGRRQQRVGRAGARQKRRVVGISGRARLICLRSSLPV